jgi:tol-pal system protein YbgF
VRIRWVVVFMLAVMFGAALGTVLAPEPARAVSKEIIQLQQQVAMLLQQQQSLQTAESQNFATLRTLVEQSLDSVNHLSSQMGALQKTVQETQANTGSNISSLSTQVQALSDSLDDVKARMGKLSDQMASTQGVVQSLDAKISGTLPPGETAPGTAPNGPGAGPSQSPGAPSAGGGPAAMPSPDLLYTNALRDFTGGNYDLARQEFSQYLQYYPTTQLASNAQFYLGEIDYAQGNYKQAVAEYDVVLTKYPRSFKQAAARLKKAYALLELHQRTAAIRELRLVIRQNPGTEEDRRARAKLRELGVAVPAR